MKLEFLMCGSPNDAFWSQAAMFRLGLDALGGPYAAARQVLCTGSTEPGTELPDRWKPHFERIEVWWADPEVFVEIGDLHCQQLYRSFDPSADLSIIVDADTLPIRPFGPRFLEEVAASGAVAATIAHVPPPLTPYPEIDQPPLPSLPALWDALAQAILGRPIERPYRYTLARGTEHERERCPFYVNHGLIITTPATLAVLAEEILAILPQVRGVLDNAFCYQLAIAYAVERGGLAQRALPMRFNFPNDPVCDRLYAAQLDQIRLVHYLRRRHFDRHRVFAAAESFERFLALPLEGSNAVFQAAVRDITGGRYPF